MLLHTKSNCLPTIITTILYSLAIGDRSFVIDTTRSTLLKDGKPFNYVSGGLHYFRVPRYYWRDRLLKMRAAGLDAVQTYVAWNIHQPQPNQFDFEGDHDLFAFLQTANDVGLLVIIRAGPYICAEWEYGGLPYWLLRQSADVKVRTMDPVYIQAVDRFYSVFLTMLKPYLYSEGGPVIMVQVENEYGSYYACDYAYTAHLRDLFRKFLGDDVILFTTDGSGLNYLKCGAINGTYATVDFGPGNVTEQFDPMRKWNPKGPLINSEFYTGWLGYWGQPRGDQSTKAIVESLDQILAMNASVNMYMFEGGTSFGYMNGADPTYAICDTSYDYNAPLSETGDITSKYMAIRNVIIKYKPTPPGPVPANSSKKAYGPVQMSKVGMVLSLLHNLTQGKPVKSQYPLRMEQVNQAYGFILYEHVIDQLYSGHSVTVEKLRDRCHVMLDGAFLAILDRNEGSTSFNLVATKGQRLHILVENQGRVNYGSDILDSSKGIVGNVSTGTQVLTNWLQYTLNFSNIADTPMQWTSSNGVHVPTVYSGRLFVNTFADTFLKTEGWFKGQAFINGYNLGRYWPVRGPQHTLYVPQSLLIQGYNTIVLLELDNAPCHKATTCQVVFTDVPELDGKIG